MFSALILAVGLTGQSGIGEPPANASPELRALYKQVNARQPPPVPPVLWLLLSPPPRSLLPWASSPSPLWLRPVSKSS